MIFKAYVTNDYVKYKNIKYLCCPIKDEIGTYIIYRDYLKKYYFEIYIIYFTQPQLGYD